MARSRNSPLNAPFAAGRTDLLDHHNRDIYRPNGLPDWTLHYTFSGLGRISSPSGTYYSPPGDVLLHKPRILSDYGVEDEQLQWTHLWATFQIHDQDFDLVSWPEILPGIYCLHIDDPSMRQRIEQLMLDLIDLYQSPYHQRMEICLSMVQTILLCCDSVNTQSHEQRIDQRIRNSMQFMHDHLEHIINLDRLAEWVDLSVSRFAHLFREQTGLTPMQYLESVRIQRACSELVMSSKPIAEIGEDVGIQDPAYFTRIFRRQTGMTPRAYRKQSMK